MATTLRDGLLKFLRELKDYAELPQPQDSDPAVHVEADARRDVCKAHATRVEQLLDLPVTDNLALFVEPSDLCVWVVLPGEKAVRLADGVNGQVQAGGRFELEDRDRAIIRTLLAVAQNELIGNAADTPRPGIQQGYPVAAPPMWNGGY